MWGVENTCPLLAEILLTGPQLIAMKETGPGFLNLLFFKR